MLGWRGNALPLLVDPVAFMTRLHRDYGAIVALARNDPHSVFAFGPAYNQQLLSDPQLYYSTSLDLNSINLHVAHDTAWYRTGTGLLGMNGARHKQQRRLIMPAFHRKQVEGYHRTIVDITQRFLNDWHQQVPVGQPRDIQADMRHLALMIASQTLFGVDASRQAQSVGHTIERWIGANASPFVLLLPFNLPGSARRRVLQVSEDLEAQIKAIINRKRAAPSAERDVLDMLLAARDEDGGALTDDELIGQATVLFVAGHETSANALTWTLFLLEQHPYVLADVLDELESVLHGAAPSLHQLAELPMLDHVVKESMRLLPPVTLSQRICMEPVAIGPYKLPSHSAINWSPYITHRLPDIYPDPQRFRPARWDTLTVSPYAYVPFGAGPRMCIGAAFAMQEIKIILAMLLQRFRLQLVPGIRVDRQVRITLQPKHGMSMVVTQQDRQLRRTLVQGNIHEMVDLNRT
ncbi:MAG: hypothetical protein NVS4B8_24200 [Herpetosiphon sp.]